MVPMEKIRAELPADLQTWRLPGENYEEDERIWELLKPILEANGLKSWDHSGWGVLRGPDPVPTGYGYAINARESKATSPTSLGTVRRELLRHQYTNPQIRLARDSSVVGDVVVRVIKLGQQGRDHLAILQFLATGSRSMIVENHTVPLLRTFDLGDITFGVFPKVGFCMDATFGFWAKNSVGDITDMVLQALEGLSFIHSLRIAHRDIFLSNLVVQWYPESLLTGVIPVTRPRVFLIDFETAVQFPPDLPFENCLTSGPPSGGSIPEDPELYTRPVPPEIEAGISYTPFKLDVWQLGHAFKECAFRTGINQLDDIFTQLVDPQWVTRPSAEEALSKFREIMSTMTPSALHIAPSFRD